MVSEMLVHSFQGELQAAVSGPSDHYEIGTMPSGSLRISEATYASFGQVTLTYFPNNAKAACVDYKPEEEKALDQVKAVTQASLAPQAMQPANLMGF